TGIIRSKQSLCRPCVDRLQMVGVLHQHSCTPSGRWNPMDLLESLATVLALVDPRAGTGVDHTRLLRIDDDREDIRVLDHTVLNVVPMFAAIGRLPRQMPRSSIDNLRVVWVDRD